LGNQHTINDAIILQDVQFKNFKLIFVISFYRITNLPN